MAVYSDRVRWLEPNRIDGQVLGRQQDYWGETKAGLASTLVWTILLAVILRPPPSATLNLR